MDTDKQRKEAEPWLANYIAQVETAIEQTEIQRRQWKAPKTTGKLESLIREKLRPALIENRLLKQQLSEYETLFPTIADEF